MPERQIPISEQIHHELDCQLVNCRLGGVIVCIPYELIEAIKNGGIYRIRRDATPYQRIPGPTGCGYYSTHEGCSVYDSEGNAIGYDLPRIVDSERTLHFILLARLYPYGTDLQRLLVGTSHVADGDYKYEPIEQVMNDLVYDLHTVQRKIFPPEKIVVGGKPYELFGQCICVNRSCVHHIKLCNLKRRKNVKGGI